MAIEYARFVRTQLTPVEAERVDRVDRLASRLLDDLEATSAAIDEQHVHGASSSAVQGIVASILRDALGFDEERVLTAEEGVVSRPRPDFVFRLGPGEGVIAEVERGGTVTNNHDLKDMWKAHLAPDVQHLFLIVPNTNWNGEGKPRERPYVRVAHRMGTFFGEPRREVDVLTCHVFGYGRPA